MIARRLKELREARGMSQAELASYLDVAQQTVASWEKDKSSPNYELLDRLANYFNVTTDELLDRNPSPQAIERYMTGILTAPARQSTQQTRKMMEAYAKLTPEKKAIAQSLMAALAKDEYNNMA